MNTEERQLYMIITTLDKLQIGRTARIQKINTSPLLQKRLEELGFSANSLITPLFCGPFSKAKAFLIKNTVFAMRYEDIKKINVITDISGDRY